MVINVTGINEGFLKRSSNKKSISPIPNTTKDGSNLKKKAMITREEFDEAVQILRAEVESNKFFSRYSNIFKFSSYTYVYSEYCKDKYDEIRDFSMLSLSEETNVFLDSDEGENERKKLGLPENLDTFTAKYENECDKVSEIATSKLRRKYKYLEISQDPGEFDYEYLGFTLKTNKPKE